MCTVVFLNSEAPGEVPLWGYLVLGCILVLGYNPYLHVIF